MVTQEKPSPKSFEGFISSFQVLQIVSEALTQITDGNDAATVTPTISRIHQKFKHCEQLLDNLPGGSMTKKEQLEEIERLRDSLQHKRQLLDRYAKHDIIARVMSQKKLPPTNAGGPTSVTAPTEPNASLNHDVNNRSIERPQSTTSPHVVNENDNDIKMDDDFGDIPGVADSLQKDDVLMGLEFNS